MQPALTFPRMAFIIVCLLGLLGLGFALYELLSPRSGTAGTAGAMLVTGSTALMAIAAGVAAFARPPGWIFGLLLVLLFLDAIGTALAGYFLMADFLVAAMLGALVALLAAAFAGRKSAKVAL